MEKFDFAGVFLANFAKIDQFCIDMTSVGERFFWEFRGISRKYLNFAGPRPREISEALLRELDNFLND